MDKSKTQISIHKKILITFIITFLLIFFLFYNLFNLANNINNEISYKNYLKERTIININNTNPEIEKIKPFPLYIKIIMGITLLLILQTTSWLVDLNEKKNKEQKENNQIENNINRKTIE